MKTEFEKRREAARGAVYDKVMQSEGRLLVVWSPTECAAMKDLLARLERLEGEQ